MPEYKRDFSKECRDMHNHICIVGDTEIGRLVGCFRDQMDMYYHIRFMYGHDKNSTNQDVYWSAVGACISLKDTYSRYDQLENTFALNGCPPSEEFIERTATPEEDEEMYGENGLYWNDDVSIYKNNEQPTNVDDNVKLDDSLLYRDNSVYWNNSPSDKEDMGK